MEQLLNEAVDCISLNADCSILAAGTMDGDIILMDLNSVEVITRGNLGTGTAIGAVEFHPVTQHTLFLSSGAQVFEFDTRSWLRSSDASPASV